MLTGYLRKRQFYMGGNGLPISEEILQNLSYNDRTSKSSVMDTSRLKIGRHSMKI